MKKRIVALSIFCVVPCQRKEGSYTELNDSIAYQYIQVGEEEIPAGQEVLHLKLTVTNEKLDTLHYVPNFNYFINPEQHPIDSALRSFHIGDSLSFKLDRELFNSYLKFYGVLSTNTSDVLMHVRLVGAYKQEEAIAIKQAESSQREIDEQAELKKYLKTIKGKLDTLGGVYRQITTSVDSGNIIQYGSEVSIHYKGYFLNGYIFDNTYEKAITPSFTFGQEYQMIDGLQTALNGRKEGERVKIILPSRHAFGEEGSLAGIVPPYTAVVYDVNIIKVIN
ncbi:MAG: FKBP-type peptidyl-prolyl cis-trans isomerase [Flavobacteriales bacterium]|nr:FKBP-type peptidyl-prolyl cis-trans isomerase [Flavobacteriales bacterium]